MNSTALAGPVAAVSFVGGVATAQGLSDTPYPIPGAPPEHITRYFRDNARAAAAAGLLAPLSLVATLAMWLSPANRFPGLLLSAGAGLVLRKRS